MKVMSFKEVMIYITFISTLTIPFYSNADCAFKKWKTHNNTMILKHKENSSYIYSIEKFSLDVDGAPNAYHPQDKGKNCKSSTDFLGLDCLQNAGYKNGNWKSIIIPAPINSDEGYVQPSGEYKGYFVSQTSLKDHSKINTDINKYVNSLKIPYIVIPSTLYSMKGTGMLGDVGYAVNVTNGLESPFIIAETGPKKSNLGEISFFLASALGGNNLNARTGSGLPKGKVIFIVFPGSAKKPSWPVSYIELKSMAERKLNEIGGKEKILTCTM